MGSGGGGSGLAAGKRGKIFGGEYATITEKNVNQLIDMGANRWTKGGHDRLYLSGAGEKIVGLDVDYYKSGRVSSANINGEGISNSKAEWIMHAYSRAYVDLKTGELVGVRGRESDIFVDAMKKYLRYK